MLPFSTKTQKERKGLDTSPFGALRLTIVPIPCVSVTFLGNRTQDCQNGGTADYADWSRLGAGYRRQDCQNRETQINADFGVLEHSEIG